MHEERVRVVAAVAAGRSYWEVAKEFDVSTPTVMRWFRAANPADLELMTEAVQAVKDGHSIALVARVARVPREELWTWLRAALPRVRQRASRQQV